jgi:hypothetical protein
VDLAGIERQGNIVQCLRDIKAFRDVLHL